MSQVERIVALASPVTREHLLGEDDGSMPAGPAMFCVMHDLIEAHPTDPEGWQWSVKGQAVRAALASMTLRENGGG